MEKISPPANDRRCGVNGCYGVMNNGVHRPGIVYTGIVENDTKNSIGSP